MDPIDQGPVIVDRDMDEQVRGERRGQLSVFTCPECGGALWQVDESRPLRFRCHVGHAYHAEILLAEQTESLEAALWTAVRTFREKSVLARQLANRERTGGDVRAADRFDEQAAQASRYGNLIHDYLLNGAPGEGM
jgi:two-component system chemotaxis response regulator CheB